MLYCEILIPKKEKEGLEISAFGSTGCSYKPSRFSSQHLHDGSAPSLTTVSLGTRYPHGT